MQGEILRGHLFDDEEKPRGRQAPLCKGCRCALDPIYARRNDRCLSCLMEQGSAPVPPPTSNVSCASLVWARDPWIQEQREAGE